MINVSNAFKQELYDGHRNYLEYVDITLKDGTELHLTNKDLWQGGITIEDKVSEKNVFEIGGAYDNSATFSLENIEDRFSDYDFDGADVIAYVGLNLPDGKMERVRKGTFTVNNPKYNTSVITIPCLGNMQKFDKLYSESKLSYPATLNQIVMDACDVCDVTLQTIHFPHDDFMVQTRPADEATTFRDVVSWAAQIAGCFAKCDVYGRLELKWYDQELLEKHGYDGGIFDKENPSKYVTGDTLNGGSFNPWEPSDSADGGSFQDLKSIHHIYSHYSAPDVSTDDVVITGIRVIEKVEDENDSNATVTYLSGAEGYVIEILGNDLIRDGNGGKISNWLGGQLIGFRFRRATLTHASDPTIEAGDVGIVTNRKQQSFPVIISSTRFSTGGSQTTESSAATPARNSSRRFSAETKNYVDYRRDLQKERTSREKAQEELKKRIDNSPGLFTTEEVQPDESRIFYLHNKPNLSESDMVWKMTAEAWGVSTDGGKTYNAGMTVDGDTIVRILTAVGINADWIKTGAFLIEKNGKIMVKMDINTGQVILRPDTFELSDGRTIDSIAEKKAEDAVKGQTQADIFDKVTDGGKIQGLFMKDGKIYVNASYILSGILALGGANNGNGTCVVRDASGNALVTLDNNGITLAPSVRIAWSNISGTGNIAEIGDIPTNKEIINLINENKWTIITKDYIETLKIIAGSVAAENITGTTISGKTLTGATGYFDKLVMNAGTNFYYIGQDGKEYDLFYMASSDYVYAQSRFVFRKNTVISNRTRLQVGGTEPYELVPNGCTFIMYDDSSSSLIISAPPKEYSGAKDIQFVVAMDEAHFNNRERTGYTNVFGIFMNQSDIRYKKLENQYMSPEISKSIITRLTPIAYEYTDGTKGLHRGFAAQEVEEIMDDLGIPECVYQHNQANDRYYINQTELIPDLVNCVQDLYRKNEEMQHEIDRLKRMMEDK